MIYDLIPSSDPLLHEKIKKCSYNLDRKDISFTLNENMLYHNGVGLSANQLGINKRVAVVNVTEPIYLINPEIISVGKEVIFQEGCLSVKSKKPIHTKRFDSITIKCDNYESNM